MIALARLVDDGALKGSAGDRLATDLRAWDKGFKDLFTPGFIAAGLPPAVRSGGAHPMSPQVGINPTLMTQLINGMKRVSSTIPDVGLEVERALTSLEHPTGGPDPAPCHRPPDERPDPRAPGPP